MDRFTQVALVIRRGQSIEDAEGSDARQRSDDRAGTDHSTRSQNRGIGHNGARMHENRKSATPCLEKRRFFQANAWISDGYYGMAYDTLDHRFRTVPIVNGRFTLAYTDRSTGLIVNKTDYGPSCPPSNVGDDGCMSTRSPNE